MKAFKKTIIFLPILIFLISLSSWTEGSDKDYYLGSQYKGNYVWGGAMNLAWNELNEKILHEKLKLKTDDKVALEMVDKFNHSPFTKNDLDEKSYYIKSGYGEKTVDLINKESRVKFPQKTFKDLEIKLGPKDIISYAYFLKEVEYPVQFKEGEVLFEKEQVKGFYASDAKQKENVRILKYWDDQKFIISLKLKDDADALILAKGFNMDTPKDALSEIDKCNKYIPATISQKDVFKMPKLHLDHLRNYVELVGKYLANKGFEEYDIASMFENIRFDMDHKGARVEQEAVIKHHIHGRPRKVSYKRLVLDKPFWVVMKRENRGQPYFVLGVKNTELMEKIKTAI